MLSICSLVIVVASVFLVVYGFMDIFRQSGQGAEKISRQLRGFAMLLLAQMVMLLGMMLCSGTLLPAFQDMISM